MRNGIFEQSEARKARERMISKLRKDGKDQDLEEINGNTPGNGSLASLTPEREEAMKASILRELYGDQPRRRSKNYVPSGPSESDKARERMIDRNAARKKYRSSDEARQAMIDRHEG